MIAVVRGMLLKGLNKHPPAEVVSAQMLAATLSWAIYGAAKEWLWSPGRCSPKDLVDQVMALLQPLLGWRSRLAVQVLSWCDYLDLPKRIESEQIGIAGEDNTSSSGKCESQEHVVLRIAACCYFGNVLDVRRSAA